MNIFFNFFLIYIIRYSLALYLPLIHGRYTRNIEDYELTIPKEIIKGQILEGVRNQWFTRDYGGSWWSAALKHNRQKRHTRLEPPWCSFQYKYQDRVEVVDLWPNLSFMSPQLAIETHSDNDKKIVPIGKRQCYFIGGLRGDKNSRAAVNLCFGMTGYIISSEQVLFIEPHESSVPDDRGAVHLHIIHKAGVEKSHKRRVKREIAKKDVFCATTNQWKKAWLNQILSKEFKNTIRKRSASKHRFLEILAVVDKKFIDHHKNIDKETYLLTILNMASYFYHDASVGNMIDFVTVKIIYLEKENEKVEMDISHDAEKTLPSFCEWQAKVNLPHGSPYHHDIAILITRYDICSDAGTECSLLGLANVATACDPKLACAINEDSGLMLGLTITHEVAHVLGCSHDEPAISGCSSESPDGTYYMMSPYASMYSYTWSPCSRKYITTFLDNALGECLLNPPPSPSPYHLEQMPPGAMYDADFQCRNLYGPEAKECPIDGKICENLFCKIGTATNCKSKGIPYADGTPCGANKWCIKKKCVMKGQRPEAVDGAWGQWGPMGTCSRTCGGGVAIAQRDCDNPQPANLGRYCLGERIKYELCNTSPCKESSKSFRQEQCSHFNDELFEGEKHHWKAFIPQKPGSSCRLGCINEKESYKVLKESVVDGTPCKAGTRNLCVAGACKDVGCDWKLNSKVFEDQCGICGGNGITCKKKEGQYTETKGGYQKIVDVPKKATKIKFEQIKPSDGNIAIALPDKTFILNGDFSQNRTGEFEAVGTILIFHQPEEDKDLVELVGPIDRDIVAMYVQYEKPNPGVQWTFYEYFSNPNYKPVYVWEFLDWNECSLLCGGGVEKSEPSCVEKVSGKVTDRFCLTQENLTKPEPLTRSCNTEPCTAKWKLAQWGPCDGCLFRSGWRLRKVSCVVQTSHAEVEPSEVELDQCPPPKPPIAKLCNAKGACSKKSRRGILLEIRSSCDNRFPLVFSEISAMKRTALKRQCPNSNEKFNKAQDKIREIEKEYKVIMKTMSKDCRFDPKNSIIIEKPPLKNLEYEVDVSVQENNLYMSDEGFEKIGDTILDIVQIGEIKLSNSKKYNESENDTIFNEY